MCDCNPPPLLCHPLNISFLVFEDSIDPAHPSLPRDRISNAKVKQLKLQYLYSLDTRRTYLDISTELVVHTSNWESRHNFLAPEEVNNRGLHISFALFPESINNEYTEYFIGIQREYFK